MNKWFHRVVLSRRWVTFVALGLSFLVFGSSSLNLIFVAKANLELIAAHGWQALTEGGAQQLLELLATTYASMVAYVVFKACEYKLVHSVIDPANAHH